MNRREFAGLVGAGVLFPIDLVRGLAKPEEFVDLEIKWGEIPDHLMITVLGSVNEPATDEHVRAYDTQVARTLISYTEASHGLIPSLAPRLDIPYNQYYVRTKHLVLVLGSPEVSLSDQELNTFRNHLLVRLFQGENMMTSHYPIIPMHIEPHFCSTFPNVNFSYPQVISYDLACKSLANFTFNWSMPIGANRSKK